MVPANVFAALRRIDSVSWFILGPSHPWRGVIVAWGTMSIVPAVPASAIVRRLPHQWFRVPDGLLSLEHGAQASFIAHGICFAMHVLLAVLALFQQAPMERRTMGAVAGLSCTSLPGAAPAFYHASTPASVAEDATC